MVAHSTRDREIAPAIGQPLSPRALWHAVKAELAGIMPSSEAQSVTRLLLEELLQMPYHRLLTEDKEPIGEDTLRGVRQCVLRLLAHEPIQYVLGFTEFAGFRFSVSPAVLIPRPETEQLTLALAKVYAKGQGHILEVGTGSGAIAISLALLVPTMQVSAIEMSEAALRVAEGNAGRLKAANIRFAQADALQHIAPWDDTARYRLVVSNPPYIPIADRKNMDERVVNYEPDSALFVPDNDPLLFYRAILRGALPILEEEGIVVFEIYSAYSQELQRLAQAEGYEYATICKDHYGRDRFLACAMPKGELYLSQLEKALAL